MEKEETMRKLEKNRGVCSTTGKDDGGGGGVGVAQMTPQSHSKT